MFPNNPRYVLNDNDHYTTPTSVIQHETEKSIQKFYDVYFAKPEKFIKDFALMRALHKKFLINGLENLPKGFTSLDASRPWILYWLFHSLDLLGIVEEVLPSYSQRSIKFLKSCEHPKGGYGGGPYQLAHLAPTYAAVNALAIIGTKEAFESIDRKKLLEFLLNVKDPSSGGFCMHEDGEIDIRGTYCALSVACLCNILTPEVTKGIPDFIKRCQTYEGGFAGYPGNEAHGGYTFCGMASMFILNEIGKEVVDVESLAKWSVSRQMKFEGGFNGRTNKLVDSCYSFWVGSNFPMLNALLASRLEEIGKKQLKMYDCLQWKFKGEQKIKEENDEVLDMEDLEMEEKYKIPKKDHLPELVNNESLMNQTSLQAYILICCQNKQMGGLRDKPSKYPDFYHTCYSLSGLSIAQHNPSGRYSIFGSDKNLLREINPVFNICKNRVSGIIKHFGDRETV